MPQAQMVINKREKECSCSLSLMTSVTQFEVLSYFVNFPLFLALDINHLVCPAESFLNNVFFPSLHSCRLFFLSLRIHSSYPNNSQRLPIPDRIKTKHVTWNSRPFSIRTKPLISCNSIVHFLLESSAFSKLYSREQ